MTAMLVKITCSFPHSQLETVLSRLQELGSVHLIPIEGEKPALHIDISRVESLLAKIKESLGSLQPSKPIAARLFGERTTLMGRQRSDKEARENAENALFSLTDKLKKKEKVNARVWSQRLHLIQEELSNIHAKLQATAAFGASSYTYTFSGFADRSKEEYIRRTIDSSTGGKNTWNVEPVVREDDPPTLLSNPRLVRPFEVLTRSFGLPPYGGFDPTGLLALTFVLLFGFMFPDIGYGAMIALFSGLAALASRKVSHQFRDINIILVYCGLSGMTFGLIAGEFFGGLIHLPFRLIEPANDVLIMLIISILLGAIHLSLAMISGMVTGRQVMRVAGLLLILWSAVFFFFLGDKWLVLPVGAGLALLFRGQKIRAVKELFELVTHIVSYLRIGILSILHVMIARILSDAILAMPQNMFGIIMGAALLIIGGTIALIMGMVIVFIQSLRLQWLEFFSGFEFGGRPFEPFQHRREYLYK